MSTRFIAVAATATVLGFACIAADAQKGPNKNSPTNIEGTLTVPAGSTCDLTGTLVYVPGKSFIARLDDSGEFRIYNFPTNEGTSTPLWIEVPDKPALKQTVNLTAVTTSLGNISLEAVCPGDSGGGGGGGGTCAAPDACSDSNECTVDTCDESIGCSHTPATTGQTCGTNGTCDGAGACVEPVDADGDGWSFLLDCDDANDAIYPGATEICGNGVDDDCDTQIDENCSSP